MKPSIIPWSSRPVPFKTAKPVYDITDIKSQLMSQMVFINLISIGRHEFNIDE
jgi:hypothetical protein